MSTSLITVDRSDVSLRQREGPDTLALVPDRPSEPGLPVIEGYEILSELGRGGMGIVYKARDLKLKRLVAIKMLLDPEFASAEQRMRFRIEAEAVAQLKHPNIVQVYELGELRNARSSIPHPYMVLEYVDGPTLFSYRKGHQFTEREAASLMITLARAMQHAHDHGLIHRDLKPANILLGSSDSTPSSETPAPSRQTVSQMMPEGNSGVRCLANPKITDFGLVKAIAFDGDLRRDLTRPEFMVGTPQYMAPEQANPEPMALSSSVDIYSLGVIFYELLTGRLPYNDKDVLKMLMEVQTTEPVSPRKLQPRLSADVETICLKCLEKEPRRRYTSAAALADDLGRYLHHEPIHARPLSEWQRITKWVQRYPTVATLVGTLFAVICTALVIIATLWRQADTDRQQAVEHSIKAEIARDIARSAESQARTSEQAAVLSEQQSQRALYFSKVAQAELLLRQGQLLRPMHLLRECSKSPLFGESLGWEWFHLMRQCRPMEQQISASADYVQKVVFHPHREMMLSIEGAEYFSDLKPADFPGKLLLHRPDPHSGQWHSRVAYINNYPLRDMQLALQGSKVLLANMHNEVVVLDYEDLLKGRENAKPVPLPRQLRWKLAADVGWVFLWNQEKPGPDVKVFDVGSGEVTRLLTLPGDIVELAVSRTGELLFFLTKGAATGVWQVKENKLLWQKQLPAGEYRLAQSGNGKQVAYSTFPVGDLVWMEAATGKILNKWTGVPCDGIQLSDQGDRLVGSCLTPANHDVFVWHRSAKGEASSMPLTLRGHLGIIRGYEFDRTGNRLITIGVDGSVRLWDTSQDSPRVGNCLQHFRGHAGTVLSAAFDPHGKFLATGGIDANIMLWNTEHSIVNDLFPVTSGSSGEWINGYAFIEGTSLLAVFNQSNGQLDLWDLSTSKVVQKHSLPEAFTSFRAPRYDASFSGNGRLFSVLDKEAQRVLLYETMTGKLLWTTPKADIKILQVYLSGNSKRLLFAGHYPQPGNARQAVSYKCEYQVWDIERKELVHKATLDRFCHCWTINHDGSRVAAALRKPGTQFELAVLLVDEGGKQLYAEPFNLMRCMSLAFSRDGKYLAGCNFDSNKNWLTIRNAQTGKELHRKQSAFESTYVTFTPDSRRVLVTGYDSHAIMFDPVSGHEVLTLKHHGLPRQNDYALSPKLVFNPDGTMLAVHSWDGGLTIWHSYNPTVQDVTKLFPSNIDDRFSMDESMQPPSR